MTKAMGQLSIAIGGILFVIVFVVTVSMGVPVLTAVFRGWVVMCVSSVAVALLLRFFAAVLYRFVAEEVIRQRQVRKMSAGQAADKGGQTT